MGTAHLAPHRPIKTLAQAIRVGLIGGMPDRVDIGRRPVKALRRGTVGGDCHQVSREDAKYVAIKRRIVVRVIEHEEIGHLLLAQLARNIGHGEEPLRHAREGEEALGLVEHHDVEAQMIAGQRQRAVALVPDRHSKRPAQRGPQTVAEFLPGDEEHARVRPGHRILGRHADAGEHIVAVVKPQIGGNDCPARASPRLAIKAVLRRHPHQNMDEADIAAYQHLGAVRTVHAQRVRHALQVAPLDRFSVEAQDAGDGAHREATNGGSTLASLGRHRPRMRTIQ